jgi:hypothetical protein
MSNLPRQRTVQLAALSHLMPGFSGLKLSDDSNLVAAGKLKKFIIGIIGLIESCLLITEVASLNSCHTVAPQEIIFDCYCCYFSRPMKKAMIIKHGM